MKRDANSHWTKPCLMPGEAGARKRPETGWASLTPAEIRVADLVKDGLPNGDISRRLLCSARAVQAHLTHIYAEHGCLQPAGTRRPDHTAADLTQSAIHPSRRRALGKRRAVTKVPEDSGAQVYASPLGSKEPHALGIVCPGISLEPLAADLEAFAWRHGGDIEVRRLGVLPEHIARFGMRPKPGPGGQQTVEAEAYPSGALAALVQEAREVTWDQDAYDKTLRRLKRQRGILIEQLGPPSQIGRR
jgi:DNA-binding CsgD family transcriptional regulator